MNIMLAGAPLSWWIGFHVLVVVLLVVDLLLLRHEDETRERKLAWAWTLLLFLLASSSALLLLRLQGRQPALEFFSSYLVESSLSVDNLFVFLLMFRALGLDREQQHRVLLWGLGGAIVMRALFIAAGVSLLARFHWVEDIFGAFLLYAAVRLLLHDPARGKPSALVRWIHGRSTTRLCGAPDLSATSFLLIIIAVEATDLVFALDSIPAVLAITRDPFVAYTSNIFAVLGLRSLFFALSGMLDRFRLLHYGLAAILAFVAVKMLLARWIEVPVGVSLGVIVGILAAFIAASLIRERSLWLRGSGVKK